MLREAPTPPRIAQLLLSLSTLIIPHHLPASGGRSHRAATAQLQHNQHKQQAWRTKPSTGLSRAGLPPVQRVWAAAAASGAMPCTSPTRRRDPHQPGTSALWCQRLSPGALPRCEAAVHVTFACFLGNWWALPEVAAKPAHRIGRVGGQQQHWGQTPVQQKQWGMTCSTDGPVHPIDTVRRSCAPIEPHSQSARRRSA